MTSSNNTISYASKLPSALNSALKKFTGNECLLVNYFREGKILKNTAGNCHVNVRAYIEEFGGKAINGWILNRDKKFSDFGLYVWSFHSVWEKPDGKWVDVTEDKHYLGKDKSQFVPDANRTVDLNEGIGYNNFMIFTEQNFAAHYGKSIGAQLFLNEVYWTDSTMQRVMNTEQHNGIYRFIRSEYPNNINKMCEEYELEIINGRPIPKPGSKYSTTGAPMKMLFDYSVSSHG